MFLELSQSQIFQDPFAETAPKHRYHMPPSIVETWNCSRKELPE